MFVHPVKIGPLAWPPLCSSQTLRPHPCTKPLSGLRFCAWSLWSRKSGMGNPSPHKTRQPIPIAVACCGYVMCSGLINSPNFVPTMVHMVPSSLTVSSMIILGSDGLSSWFPRFRKTASGPQKRNAVIATKQSKATKCWVTSVHLHMIGKKLCWWWWLVMMMMWWWMTRQ